MIEKIQSPIGKASILMACIIVIALVIYMAYRAGEINSMKAVWMDILKISRMAQNGDVTSIRLMDALSEYKEKLPEYPYRNAINATYKSSAQQVDSAEAATND